MVAETTAVRVTPIPDAEMFTGHVRKVVAPPDNDLLDGVISAVEAQVELPTEEGGLPQFRFRIMPDDGDVERLAAGEPVWLSMMGHVVPFSFVMLSAEQ